MNKKESLIDFPCDFPVKIIGENTDLFFAEVMAIARKHFPDIAETAVNSRESQQGKFLAITVTVYVKSQKELDAFYLEVTQHPDIKMVL